MTNATVHSTVSPLAEMAKGLAAHAATHARPISPSLHLLQDAAGHRVFIPNGSRLLAVSAEAAARLAQLMAQRDEALVQSELVALGLADRQVRGAGLAALAAEAGLVEPGGKGRELCAEPRDEGVGIDGGKDTVELDEWSAKRRHEILEGDGIHLGNLAERSFERRR